MSKITQSTFVLLIVLFGSLNLAVTCAQEADKKKSHKEEILAAQTFLPTQSFPLMKTIKGQVRDEQGNSIEGATTFFYEGYYSGNRLVPIRNILDRPHQLSASDGTFEIRFKSTAHAVNPILHQKSIVVYKEGFAPTITSAENSSLNLTLRKGRTLTGEVITENGNPIVGAKVTLKSWLHRRDSNIVTNSANKWLLTGTVQLGSNFQTTTNKQGAWSLANTPKESSVVIEIECPGYASRLFIFEGAETGHIDDDRYIVQKSGSVQILPPDSAVALICKSADGETVPLAKVTLQKTSARGRITTEVLPFNAAGLFNLPKENCDLIIEPLDRSTYLSKRIPIHLKDEIPVEKEVVFEKGTTLRGRVVDEKTGKGIAGITVQYDPTKRTSRTATDTSLATPVLTAEDGSFAIAIANGSGQLRVVGPIKGYSSIANFSQARENKIKSRFERKVTFNDKGSPEYEDLEFRLEKAYRVVGVARDQNGKPVPNVQYTTTRLGKVIGSNMSLSQIIGTTDDQGRFEFDWIYHNPFELGAARAAKENKNNPAGQVRRTPRVRYPMKITFVQMADNLGALTDVTLPEEGDSVIELDVVLTPLASVTGQFLDTKTKEPLANVRVQCNIPSASGARALVTYSNEKGFFKITGVQSGLRFNAHLTHPSANFERPISVMGLTAMQNMDVGKIEGLNLPELTKDLPKLDISGLENEAALESIITYIEQQFDQVPWEENKFFRNSSSINTVSLFVKRVYRTVGPPTLELAARIPGTDFEGEVFAKVITALNSRRSSYFIANFQSSAWVQKAFRSLIEDHIDQPISAELVKTIVRRNLKLFEDNPWQRLMEQSSNWELRGSACYVLANKNLGELLRDGLKPSLSDEAFEETLEEARKFTKLAITTYAAAEYNASSTIGDKTRTQLIGMRRSFQRRGNLAGKLKNRHELLMEFTQGFLEETSGG